MAANTGCPLCLYCGIFTWKRPEQLENDGKSGREIAKTYLTNENGTCLSKGFKNLQLVRKEIVGGLGRYDSDAFSKDVIYSMTNQKVRFSMG